MHLSSLITAYQADPDSGFHKLRQHVRANYSNLCDRIARDHGDTSISDIGARSLLRWHEAWAAGGRLAMAHALVGMLRTLATFGAVLLEDANCRALKTLLHNMRFQMPKPRTERMTAAQAALVCATAHRMARPSVALAQAIQFECMFRQKDVIGEWEASGGPADALEWSRGIQWQEIDENFTLRHVTSKRQKEVTINLRLAPMVLRELCLAAGLNSAEELTRAYFPATGPVIRSEATGLPYRGYEFRRAWRRVADACGFPRELYNMDTRAGAISEATDAGASLELVRHAATHSNISTTAHYSRGATEKVMEVQKARSAYRLEPERADAHAGHAQQR